MKTNLFGYAKTFFFGLIALVCTLVFMAGVCYSLTWLAVNILHWVSLDVSKTGSSVFFEYVVYGTMFMVDIALTFLLIGALIFAIYQMGLIFKKR